MKKVEILAPAGSLDICKAVIKAGADAVYLGGDMFGARAYAGNLNREQLLEAIDYAHIRDASIYLTVNTLLKEHELNNALIDYLAPYYEAGLDAVIVQDLGVFRAIKNNFPDMNIHASTQMTITGTEGAKLLKEMGASRVVTARELTVADISDIHKNVDIEIESFVHGALCYCYSGQCLLSSSNGPRSGNRGRCAQSCRLAMDVIDKGRVINNKDSNYPLSPRDMCALPILPDVIDAGVYSLKIEGRMKNVTYAAGVTAMYRKYVDMYLEKGRRGYSVSKEDMLDLMDIYNRGGFTTGYYVEKKGPSMMSVARPNHMGTCCLRVVNNVNGRVTFKVLRPIYPKDVFEIDSENSFSSGEFHDVNEQYTVNLPKKYPLYKGREIYRTRKNNILEAVEQSYVNDKKTGCERIDMQLYAHTYEPMKLTVKALGQEAVVYGELLEPALKSRMTAQDVSDRLAKLGNSDFVAGTIAVDMSEDAFIPVAWINDIRRQAVETLTKNITESYRRNPKSADSLQTEAVQARSAGSAGRAKSLLVTTKEQLHSPQLTAGDYSTLYAEYTLLSDEESRIRLRRLAEEGLTVAVGLPHIITNEHKDRMCKLLDCCRECGIDTFLVRNLEELGLLDMGAKVITDANLYCWNSSAYRTLKEMVESKGLKLIRVTCPHELTYKELAAISIDAEVELMVYGYIPAMVSKQCVRRTYNMCDHSNNTIALKDKRLKQEYCVKSYCDFCYSLMYNKNKLNITQNHDIINIINPDSLRYELALPDMGVSIDYDSSGCDNSYMGHIITGVD